MQQRILILPIRNVLLAAAVALVVSCGFPRGQKLLRLEVSRGAETLLVTSFDAADSSTTTEIWIAAGEAPFSTEFAAASLTPDVDAPLRLTLQGPIAVRITHVRSEESAVELPNVTLVRSTPTSDDWRLTAEDTKRAAALAAPRR